MTTTIYVCTTCKVPDDPSPDRAGARLIRALEPLAREHGFAVEGVECLSVCKRPCTIAFAAENKWTYVYGDFSAEESAATILECASLYRAAHDGLIPWKERPDAMKKGVIARLPPSLTSSRAPEPHK